MRKAFITIVALALLPAFSMAAESKGGATGATENIDQAAPTLQTLLDRMQIEDLFIRYYSGALSGGSASFDKFYVEGGELDVNGIVVHGFKEIADLYKKVAEDKPKLTGTFRMLLTNPVIEVTGNNATAQFLWTQTLNDTIKGPPRFIEQGMEYDKLVRTPAGWRIKKRVVIADSGLPDLFDATYQPRKGFNVSML